MKDNDSGCTESHHSGLKKSCLLYLNLLYEERMLLKTKQKEEENRFLEEQFQSFRT